MKKLLLVSAVAAVCLAGGLFAYRAAVDRGAAPDKIVCPLTGAVICADECPLGEQREAATETPACCSTSRAVSN